MKGCFFVNQVLNRGNNGIFSFRIFQYQGYDRGLTVRGDDILFKEGNGCDFLFEIRQGPFSGDVHGPFDAGKADDPPYPFDFFKGFGQPVNSTECFRIKNIFGPGHNQDNFFTSKGFFKGVVLIGLWQIFNGQIVYGGFKTKMRDLPGKYKGQENNGKDDPPGMVNHIFEPGFRQGRFGALGHMGLYRLKHERS